MQVVDALKRRAAAHGQSAEAEHREILRKTLLADHYCPKKVADCSHNTLFYIFKKAKRGCHRLEPREPLRPCFLPHAQGGAICIPVNSFFPR